MDSSSTKTKNAVWRMLLMFMILVTWSDVAIAVGGLPRIQAESTTITAVEGESTHLNCPVEKDPTLLVEWYKDGRQINVELDHFKQTRRGLKIHNVTWEDRGTYVCRAINGFGRAEISIGLLVGDDDEDDIKDTTGMEGSHYQEVTPVEDSPKPVGTKPFFTSSTRNHGKNIQRPLGSNLRIKCMATGEPMPEVYWVKDGHHIGREKAKIGQWTLLLQELESGNSGQYTCVARNIYGTINTTFTVDVIDRVRNKPELTGSHPLNTTVEVGQTASFQCRVRSDVPPHIQWLKQVEDVSSLTKYNRTFKFGEDYFRVLKSSEVLSKSDGSYLNKLIISQVSEEDSGVYICLGANTVGYSIRKAFLTVISNANKKISHEVTSRSDKTSLVLIIGLLVGAIFVLIAAFILCLRCRRKSPTPTATCQRGAEAPLRATTLPKSQFPPKQQQQQQQHSSNSSSAHRKTPESTATMNGFAHYSPTPRIPPSSQQWVDLPPPSAVLTWSSSGGGTHHTQYPHPPYANVMRNGNCAPSSYASESIDIRSGSGGSGHCSSTPRVYHHNHQHVHYR